MSDNTLFSQLGDGRSIAYWLLKIPDDRKVDIHFAKAFWRKDASTTCSPAWMQFIGMVYWPIKPSPMKSSSWTTNRTRARSGKLMWNSKLSSNTGLKPAEKKVRFLTPWCKQSICRRERCKTRNKFMWKKYHKWISNIKDLTQMTGATKMMLELCTFKEEKQWFVPCMCHLFFI